MLSPDPASAQDPSRRTAGASRPQTFCFSVQAAAEPGVMPRVLGLFAKRNLVPERWVSGVDGQGTLTIDLQVAGLDGAATAYIARCLRELAYVRTVLTSEKAGL